MLFEHGKFEPVGRQNVGHPHRAAARAGDHRDAVAFRQFAEGKGGGDVERMIEVFAADDPVMAEDRIVDRSGMRQGAGMRGRGSPACLGAADLGEDHRLSSVRRLFGDGAEAGRVLDAFEIGDEDVGAAKIDQPIEVIVRFQANLVTGAGLVGKTQLPGPATAQKCEGQGAALTADRDRPALAARREEALLRVVEHRAEGRDEGLQRVDDAFGIGAADDNSVALDDLAQRLVARLRRLAALLGKARADDDRGAHAPLAAFLERRRDIGRRHHDDSEIGRLRQFGDGRIASQPEHFGMAARHRVDAARVAVRDQELGGPAAQGVRIARRADDRDTVRREKRTKIGHRPNAGRGRGR